MASGTLTTVALFGCVIPSRSPWFVLCRAAVVVSRSRPCPRCQVVFSSQRLLFPFALMSAPASRGAGAGLEIKRPSSGKSSTPASTSAASSVTSAARPRDDHESPPRAASHRSYLSPPASPESAPGASSYAAVAARGVVGGASFVSSLMYSVKDYASALTRLRDNLRSDVWSELSFTEAEEELMAAAEEALRNYVMKMTVVNENLHAILLDISAIDCDISTFAKRRKQAGSIGLLPRKPRSASTARWKLFSTFAGRP